MGIISANGFRSLRGSNKNLETLIPKINFLFFYEVIGMNILCEVFPKKERVY